MNWSKKICFTFSGYRFLKLCVLVEMGIGRIHRCVPLNLNLDNAHEKINSAS